MALTVVLCTAILGEYCDVSSALRSACLMHRNFIQPNIYISSSFRKKELLLLLLTKINKRLMLCVVKKFLFLTRRGDIDHFVVLLH